MAIISYHKHYGETLAVMLERFQSDYPEYRDTKITYAGRLDPMASGIIILLTGDDVHKKDDYNQRDKIYEVEFILGIETDTYDILGEIQHSHKDVFLNADIDYSIKTLKGDFDQPYPPFSSRTVSGKPLWQWTREGNLEKIEIPHKKISVYSAEYHGYESIDAHNLFHQITESLSLVQGDFRQQLILSGWKKYFNTSLQKKYFIYKATFHVSSGTYIRSLIYHLGKQLGKGAICLHIYRKQIGEENLTI